MEYLSSGDSAMRIDLTVLLLCLVVMTGGCSKRSSLDPQSATPGLDHGAAKTIDPCSLLTSKDIEETLGAALQNTKPSTSTQAGLSISQCYFQLPAATDSIVISVTQRAATNARNPREVWNQIFYGDKGKRITDEETEKKQPPEKIADLGDDAFWVPRRFGGKLYVLRNDLYITVGVGSPGDQIKKIEKAKALAAAILEKI
jgi:hypothetical protein